MKTLGSMIIAVSLLSSTGLFAYDTYSVTNGLDIPDQVGTGLVLPGEHRMAYVKNQDKDGYVYVSGYAMEGDPRTQSIWRIAASAPAAGSDGAWEFVLGGICPNDGGGEDGEVWVKLNDTFYNTFWGGTSGDDRDWGFHTWYATNSAGQPAVGATAVNPKEPVHWKGTQGWPDCGQNVAIIQRTSVDELVYAGIHRYTDSTLDDLEVKRITLNGGNHDVTTVWGTYLSTNSDNYSSVIYDGGQAGRLFAVFSRNATNPDNAIYCVTNVNQLAGGSPVAQTPFKLIDLPGNSSETRPVDLEVVDLSQSPALGGGTLVAVAVVTDDSGDVRGVFMFNADQPQLGLQDITPSEGVGAYRGRLGSSGSKLFTDTYDSILYGTDVKTEFPTQLAALGFAVPEPACTVLALCGLLLLRRRR